MRKPTKIFVQTRDGRQEQGKGKEVVNLEKEVINLKEMSEKDQRGNNKEVQQQNQNKGKENAIEAAQSPLVVIREQDMDLEHEINA